MLFRSQHSGIWLWGQVFNELGAETTTILTAPTAQNLKSIDVYLIIDPDTKKETAKPNFVQKTDIQAISNWVKAGGTLIMMANDTANCEIPHFNELAKIFGVEFTNKSRNMVQGTKWEQGRVDIPAGNPVFKNTKTAYIKELVTLNVKLPAKSILSIGGDDIMATAKFGKGNVFIVGDPWLYNEYTDGRRIPTIYENFNAAKDLAKWALRVK